ncbi:MAG: DUF6144 family protein [Prolixibacteraceae bacterium]
MNTNRRNFLKQACISGGCFCGFSFLASQHALAQPNLEVDHAQKKLMQEWISSLILSLNEQTDEQLSRSIMKECAQTHYVQLKMDELLQPYEGDLEKFNVFLRQEWGWKMDYQKDTGVLIADENKNYCVCPMVNPEKGIKSPILCYCSEGIAELMFSKVVGHPVKATVISSIYRGNDRCKYQIELT